MALARKYLQLARLLSGTRRHLSLSSFGAYEFYGGRAPNGVSWSLLDRLVLSDIRAFKV